MNWTLITPSSSKPVNFMPVMLRNGLLYSIGFYWSSANRFYAFDKTFDALHATGWRPLTDRERAEFNRIANNKPETTQLKLVA